jgi:5-hydroxyisourate hydrolase
MSKLSTHVLDISTGRPARGMRLQLLDDASGALLHEAHTNADGRCDTPLLQGATMRTGKFRLRFHVADYFRSTGLDLPDPPFLDVVDLAFGIADATQPYHVPLLVSPWSYSTYRGS